VFTDEFSKSRKVSDGDEEKEDDKGVKHGAKDGTALGQDSDDGDSKVDGMVFFCSLEAQNKSSSRCCMDRHKLAVVPEAWRRVSGSRICRHSGELIRINRARGTTGSPKGSRRGWVRMWMGEVKVCGG